MQEPSDSDQKKPKAMGDDLILPIIALAFAVYYFSTIYDLSWEAQINGVLIGSILTALIIIFLVKTAAEVRKGRATLRFEKIFAPHALLLKRIGLLLLAAGYIFVIQWLGFTLTTFGFLLATMYVLGVRSRKILISISLLLSTMGFIFFIVLLDTRFPEGPIERLIERLF